MGENFRSLKKNNGDLAILPGRRALGTARLVVCEDDMVECWMFKMTGGPSTNQIGSWVGGGFGTSWYYKFLTWCCFLAVWDGCVVKVAGQD